LFTASSLRPVTN